MLMCAVVQQEFLGLSSAGADLLNQMLTYDPEKRISASAALRHPWFSEAPFPLDPSQLPTFPDTLDGNTRWVSSLGASFRHVRHACDADAEPVLALCKSQAGRVQDAEQACKCHCRDEQQAGAHGMKRRYEGRHANDRFGEAFGPAKHRKGQGR
jgi:hypothetical protein